MKRIIMSYIGSARHLLSLLRQEAIRPLKSQPETTLDETDKCYLEYGEDGYLTCSFNHTAGAVCLMDERI